MLRAHGVDWKEPSHPSGKCGVCKLAVFCRKVPVLLEKKIDFSDQKIKVMVRGYLPWQPLSIPLSARGEKARWTKPSPVRELRVPPQHTHTRNCLDFLFHKGCESFTFCPETQLSIFFIGWKFQCLASLNQNFWKLGARSLACTNWLAPLCLVHRGFGPS